MTMTTTKLALIALISCTSTAFAAAPAGKPTTTGRATIKGVDYYYEIRGKGEPLLLLHGGLMSTEMFGPALPVLAKGRQVIAVDLQGHGRTTLGTRPIRCEAIADDIDALSAAARARAGGRHGLLVRRLRRDAPGDPAPGAGAPAGVGLGAVRRRRLVRGDARSAEAGRRRDGADDGGVADVQDVQGRGAQARGLPAPAGRDGRIHARRSTTGPPTSPS